MARKIEKFGKGVEFSAKGDFACGYVEGTKTGTTSFGEAEFLTLNELVTGDKLSICISSNLKGYNWPDMIDTPVLIVFVGTEKNKNTRRTFKVYEVYELDPEDVDRIENGENPINVVTQTE